MRWRSRIYVFCLLVCANAAPKHLEGTDSGSHEAPTPIPILSQDEDFSPNGTYKYSYETGDGIKREETAYDKKIQAAKGRSLDSGGSEDGSGDEEIHVQIGSWSYTAPDGTVISVKYIADENGFRPIGTHLPKDSKVPGDSSSSFGKPRSDDSSPAASIDSASSASSETKASKAPPPTLDIRMNAKSSSPSASPPVPKALAKSASSSEPESSTAKSSDTTTTEAEEPKSTAQSTNSPDSTKKPEASSTAEPSSTVDNSSTVEPSSTVETSSVAETSDATEASATTNSP